MYETSHRLDYSYDAEIGANVFYLHESSRKTIDEWLAIMAKVYANVEDKTRPRLMILDMSKATAPLRYMRQQVLNWKKEHPEGEGYVAVVYEDSVFMTMLKTFIDMWNVSDPIKFFKKSEYEAARHWLADMMRSWEDQHQA